jgi:hypothetical protein
LAAISGFVGLHAMMTPRMLSLIVLAVAAATACAQTPTRQRAERPAGTNQVASPSVERPLTTSAIQPAAPPHANAVFGGPVANMIRSPKPWQMINPFAPREYGDGTENLSFNPHTGEADGVVLLSIKLPSKPPKPKKPAARAPAR